MATDDTKASTFVFPGSLTDFAKALRELIAASRDVSHLVSDGVKLFEKRKAKIAARSLNALSFTPDGSRPRLERIAEGKGTSDDLTAIALQMASTAGEVEDSIAALSGYRESLRENLGMAASMKLDDIIFGPSGKKIIRMTLLDIVEMSKVEMINHDDLKQSANQALRMIKILNQDLVELHDLILPPAKVQ